MTYKFQRRNDFSMVILSSPSTSIAFKVTSAAIKTIASRETSRLSYALYKAVTKFQLLCILDGQWSKILVESGFSRIINCDRNQLYPYLFTK